MSAERERPSSARERFAFVVLMLWALACEEFYELRALAHRDP